MNWYSMEPSWKMPRPVLRPRIPLSPPLTASSSTMTWYPESSPRRANMAEEMVSGALHASLSDFVTMSRTEDARCATTKSLTFSSVRKYVTNRFFLARPASPPRPSFRKWWRPRQRRSNLSTGRRHTHAEQRLPSKPPMCSGKLPRERRLGWNWWRPKKAGKRCETFAGARKRRCRERSSLVLLKPKRHLKTRRRK